MIKKVFAVFLFFLCLFTLSPPVNKSYAAGFSLNEWGASSGGQANAVVARGNDASTVAYNPAAMTKLEGTQILGGMTVIDPRGDIEIRTAGQDFGSTHNESELGIPPYFYLTRKVSDKIWIGGGVYSRFGLATKFKSDWPGRYNLYYSGINSLSFSPEVAFEVVDGLSVAGGMEIIYFEFNQKAVVRTLFPLVAVSEDINADLKVSGWGYGANAAVLYEPYDWISFGFMWRSEIKQSLSGEAKYDRSGAPTAVASGVYEDCDMKGTLMLPQSFTFGLALKPVEKVTVEVDAVWTGWSSYEKLETIYSKHPYNTASDGANSVDRDWKDVWGFRTGLEYKAAKWLDLRCGYAYDASPQNKDHYSYSLPANDRHWFSFGFGLKENNWRLDAYYIFLLSRSVRGDVYVSDSTVAGQPQTVYNSEFENVYASIFGISMGYKF